MTTRTPCIPTFWSAYQTPDGHTPSGFLFIGDPHLTHKRPGRRLEADFASVVLDKIEQAVEIANAENKIPVILGDLFQAPRDATPLIFGKLFALLARSRYRPLCNLGNHDKHESLLTEDCSLHALMESGHLWVMHSPETCAVTVMLTEGPAALLAVPYGREIPTEIVSPCPPERTVVITHEDLDFGGAYPGSTALHEVRGAHLLVNGHMHDTKPVEQRGQTVCFNPGNITRQSVDMRHHIPSVWAWVPGDRVPTAHVLRHTPGAQAFDLTGLQVEAADGAAVVADLQQPESQFAALLAGHDTVDRARTTDGSGLQEEIDTVAQALAWDPDHPAIHMLRHLLQEAVTDLDDEQAAHGPR